MSNSSPDLFLQACGATGPLELAVEPLHGRRALLQPFALVGRQPQADVFLDDPAVSARHAYVQIVGGDVLVVDLESRTGTHWADGPRRIGRVGVGEAVRVGPFSLRLLGGGSGVVAGRPALPAAVFEFQKGGLACAPWMMTKPLALIGRSGPCKVRLKDESVSRVHCSLVLTPRGVWVVDLCGREGIAVNGKSVRSALLEDADELSVGAFRIRCRYPNAEAPPTERAPVPLLVPAGPAAPALSLPAGGERDAPVARDGTAQAEAALLPLLHQFSQMQQQMADQFHHALLAVLQAFGSWHGQNVEVLRNELQQLSETTRELQELHEQLGRTRPSAAEGANAAPPDRVDGPRPPRPGGAVPPAERRPPPRPAAPASSAASEEDVHSWLQQRVEELQQERQSRWQQILQFVLGKKADVP